MQNKNTVILFDYRNCFGRLAVRPARLASLERTKPHGISSPIGQAEAKERSDAARDVFVLQGIAQDIKKYLRKEAKKPENLSKKDDYLKVANTFDTEYGGKLSYKVKNNIHNKGVNILKCDAYKETIEWALGEEKTLQQSEIIKNTEAKRENIIDEIMHTVDSIERKKQADKFFDEVVKESKEVLSNSEFNLAVFEANENDVTGVRLVKKIDVFVRHDYLVLKLTDNIKFIVNTRYLSGEKFTQIAIQIHHLGTGIQLNFSEIYKEGKKGENSVTLEEFVEKIKTCLQESTERYNELVLGLLKDKYLGKLSLKVEKNESLSPAEEVFLENEVFMGWIEKLIERRKNLK